MTIVFLGLIILGGAGYVAWSYENIIRALVRENEAERKARRRIADDFAAFRLSLVRDEEATEVVTIPGRCVQ